MGAADLFDFSAILLPGMLVLLVLALIGFIVNDLLPRRGRQVETKGVVFDNVHNVGDGKESFTPKVRFTAENGRQIEFVDGFGVANSATAIGTPVSVVYPPGQPEAARVPHPAKRTLLYSILIGMIVLLSVLWLKR